MSWVQTGRSRSTAVAASLIALSLLVGCSPAQAPTQPARNADGKPVANEQSDDSTASVKTSQNGPKAVLTQYFNAIGAGRFDNAYAFWRTKSNDAPASASDLASRYADIVVIEMAITGSIREEGAAGTVYATVPITLGAQYDGGTDRTLSGQCVLARSNDVPGSTPAQRQWRLHSCDLS